MASRISDLLKRRLRHFAHARLQLFIQLCEGPRCRRFTVAHRFLRKDGIFLHDAWLCSSLCFEAAALAALRKGKRAEPYTMPRLPRMPYRLLLLQKGVLCEEQLRAALAHAQHTGMTLGRTLLDLDYVTEAELAAALAAENGCAFYTLAPQELAPELRLPGILTDQYLAATVHGTAERIVVGFVYHIDRRLLAMVEQVTGRKAEGCFITETHRREQLALHTQAPARQRVSQGSFSALLPASPPAAARIVLERVLQIGAERVRFGSLGEMVWMRYYKSDSGCEDCLLEIAQEASVPIAQSFHKSLHAEKKRSAL